MQKLNYDELSQQLEDWAGISSSSEIHGLIAGLGSVALANNYQQVESIVMRHLEENECPAEAKTALQTMQETVMEQYADGDFSFEILLPDDDEELASRVSALAQWCQGFLIGFGTGVKSSDAQFSQEAQEVLRDLVEITHVAEELEQDGSEEDEVALTELEEYVRAAAMMLYSEFGIEQANQENTATDTFH